MLNRIFSVLQQKLPARLFSYIMSALPYMPLVRQIYLKKRRVWHAVTSESGFVVQGGPFTGMRWVSRYTDSGQIHKVLGSYESELHEAIETLVRKDYERIINVGSFDGYYAVGLARLLPKARVYAVESSPYARELCARMAELNSVNDRVIVRGKLDVHGLEGLVCNKTLVVMDCEGCEYDLLRPDLAPLLATCDYIVELHDKAKALISRFTETHEIQLVDRTRRNYSAFSVLQKLNTEERRIALEELRLIPIQWAVMVAKHQRKQPLTHGSYGRDYY